MQLTYAAASPFARKVRVLAIETDLIQRMKLIDTAVLPITHNDQVNALNPLGKVPVLLTDLGEVLYDSRVICEYLDSLHDRPRLYPAEAAERWRALRLAALADGLMEAALLVRYERAVRPAELQWDEWVEGQLGKVRRALMTLEQQATELQGSLNIAQIAVACALGYLDFRFADLAWRHGAPELASFQEGFAARESMKLTAPV
ncbi:glutathione S-transferase N-terminal domain-containing protein [Pseudomonas sp. KSR10]|jgi:glutathione S-transferase|uniref:Glutathione S-transferase n=1 Tax=Stutzerimonas stutzeri TaxID=316 RepID=A0A0D9AR73_STUST|nr:MULTISPECIES: glutathione S-transferase N-terminal domain-containing protein [Pseudomonadaceae]KJH81891.1 glutathione S-transferase [Stutzerimonas stutzeri]MCG6538540.1 glutathione S-transferase N-terminal domain-containing protein [Pseudomonas sp. KSR10]